MHPSAPPPDRSSSVTSFSKTRDKRSSSSGWRAGAVRLRLMAGLLVLGPLAVGLHALATGGQSTEGEETLVFGPMVFGMDTPSLLYSPSASRALSISPIPAP